MRNSEAASRSRAGLRSALVLLLALAGCATPGAAAEELRYQLPFASGDAHILIQGNNGQYGHTGASAYAYDFQMPIGTTVCAMRDGTVTKVVESYFDAELHKPQPGKENYIVIDQGDGTFARYYHLTHDGADVSVGDTVHRGQPIGRSGNSGASFAPHLHVDLTRGCYQWGCQTIPLGFEGIDRALVEGEAYSR